MERRYGRFPRRFALTTVRIGKRIHARVDAGVVEIGIRPRPGSSPRCIQVGRRDGKRAHGGSRREASGGEERSTGAAGDPPAVLAARSGRRRGVR
ncbi:MAG: hypothetical protein M3Q40_01750 [Pseudomonadota bacterium]|nr:hypothetical protein [Pseudomonadota bacterium]